MTTMSTFGNEQRLARAGDGCCLGSEKCTEKSPFRTPNPSEWFDKLPKTQDPGKLIAADMTNMSIQEREQAYEDIHGVRDVVNEKDRDISFDLYAMDRFLSEIRNSAAYNLALQMSREFVEDPKLRLMFLRANRFDAATAARKFTEFFTHKLELFGPEKLCKRITASDLDEEDISCLLSGRWQILPFRDRSGRTVVFHWGKKVYNYKSVDALHRANWYLMSTMQDEETQRNGIVIINYQVGCRDAPDHHLGYKIGNMSDCFFFRKAGVHFCFNSSTILPIVSALVKGVDLRSRTRFRFHEGSHLECRFSLMTYGIPVHAMPLTIKGELKVDEQIKWFERCKAKEAALEAGRNFDGVALPNPYDVLLGRGKPIQDHPGNVQLRNIVLDNKDRYEDTYRGDKAAIAQRIVETIKASSGRFLKIESDGWWHEVSDDAARAKVSHALRLKPKKGPNTNAHTG